MANVCGPQALMARRQADPVAAHASDYLVRLGEFCSRRGNDAGAQRIGALAQRLSTKTFNLVVFGEFKRGKTTFINALLGEDLLPSAVVPLTSIVTILHYSPNESIEVEFLDGSTRAISRGELPDYITERGNPENVRAVKVVRIGVPSPLLSNGMQLVDTPGVGSVYDHNTEATKEFLPQVDGAILLVASDPPISRGECEFVLEMRPHVARLFVVQNKIDQLRPEDVAESLGFTETVLHEVLGDGPVRVFPISAREALEGRLAGDHDREKRSGLEAFVEELRRFQSEEQAQTLARSVISGALRVAEDEHLSLALERQALQMGDEEIENRYADFVQRRDRILAQREDDLTLARTAVNDRLERTLQEDYERETARQAPLLGVRLIEWFETQPKSQPAKLVDRATEFIRQTLYEVLGEWRETEEQRIEEWLSQSLDRLTARTNEALAAIYESARDAFELPPRSVQTVGQLTSRSRFLWREWDWGLHISPFGSLLLQLLPGGRRRLMRAALKTLIEEHDKACGRLRYDFAQRARIECDGYVRSLERALSEALDGMDNAISRVVARKQHVTEDAVEAAGRLERQSDELDAIAKGLREALTDVSS